MRTLETTPSLPTHGPPPRAAAAAVPGAGTVGLFGVTGKEEEEHRPGPASAAIALEAIDQVDARIVDHGVGLVDPPPPGAAGGTGRSARRARARAAAAAVSAGGGGGGGGGGEKKAAALFADESASGGLFAAD